MTRAEGEPPVAEPAKKEAAKRPRTYWLSLARLECHDNENSFGGDEAYISVNGNRIWQAEEDDSMSEGETAYLMDRVQPYPFRGSAAVSLWDADTGVGGDSDDKLGENIVSIDANFPFGQERNMTFTGDGASYTLYYSVDK
jgi:hypothetical protein